MQLLKKIISSRIYKFIVVLFIWISFLSCQNQRIEKEADLLLSVLLVLNQNHFIQNNLNQDFYNKALTNYLEFIDNRKIFLTKQDVDLFYQLSQLPKNHNNDNEITMRIPNLLKISYKSYEIFQKRLPKFIEFSENFLKNPIDFSKRDKYILEKKMKSFPSTENEMKENWRKYLKKIVLDKLVDLTGKGKISSITMKSNAIEANHQVGNIIKKITKNHLTQKSGEYLDYYLNSISLNYDKYTSYYSPIDSETFNINMTGQLEGIGAQISKAEDGTIEIKGIVPGGPTYKQKALEVGDKIIEVGDTSGNMINVIPLSINEALQLIRGKKGTVAKFKIRGKDNQIHPVEIIRGKVILEETYARSTIIKTKIKNQPAQKIGYLNLHSFYGDARNPNARNSSLDVQKELNYLNANGVEGLIFDLRNNGGGRLIDAVNITGMFINKGPVVRIRNRVQEMNPLFDNDGITLFKKPLVVLINENSASASEIFASAIQDYKRGIIVGSPKSFGKGTVQTIYNFKQNKYFNSFSDIAGSIKYTIQKYYRITGKSTQTIGVIPDIIFPTQWTENPDKKRYFINDTLPLITFNKWKSSNYNYKLLRNNSQQRINKSIFFKNISKRKELIKKQFEKKESNLIFSQELKERRKYLSNLEKYKIDIPKSFTNYTILEKTTEEQGSFTDESKAKFEEWYKSLQNDYYLEEAVLVLNDIIK